MSNSLEQINELEENYAFNFFTFRDAYLIGQEIVKIAEQKNEAVCCQICAYDKLMFSINMDNTTPDNEKWAKRKGNSVLHFHHSTYYLDVKNEGNAENITKKYGLPMSEFAFVPGAFPIRLKNGGVIGYIAVSGMKPMADHQIILDAMQSVRK